MASGEFCSDEELIDAVQHFPAIWQVTDPYYRVNHSRSKAFELVREHLDLADTEEAVDWVRKRWKNIPSSYQQTRAKKNPTGTSLEDKIKVFPGWKTLDSMLRPFLESEQRDNNCPELDEAMNEIENDSFDRVGVEKDEEEVMDESDNESDHIVLSGLEESELTVLSPQNSEIYSAKLQHEANDASQRVSTIPTQNGESSRGRKSISRPMRKSGGATPSTSVCSSMRPQAAANTKPKQQQKNNKSSSEDLEKELTEILKYNTSSSSRKEEPAEDRWESYTLYLAQTLRESTPAQQAYLRVNFEETVWKVQNGNMTL